MKPSIESLTSRIKQMIQEDLLQTPPDFHPDSSLFELGMDSMAIMQFLLLLEEEFEISIPVESVSIENFKSVRSVANLLASRLSIDSGNTDSVATCNEEKVIPHEVVTQGFAFDANAVSMLPGAFDTIDLQGTDLFVCGFEKFNQRRGLRGHWAYTVIELEGTPEIESLKTLCEWLPKRFKIINAVVTPAKWFRPSRFQSTTHTSLPLTYWFPQGGAPEKLPWVIESEALLHAGGVKRVLQQLIHDRVDRRDGPPEHVNFDVIVKPSGDSVFVMSWNHLIFDGVGAEEFLIEVQRFWTGRTEAEIPPYGPKVAKLKPWLARYASAKPMLDRFRQLIGQQFASLGEVVFESPQSVEFEAVTLSEDQTAKLKLRVAASCGELINLPYYLACVMRAHQAVHAYRGEENLNLLASIPIQTRLKGASGPIFQNQLTMFYVKLAPEDCDSLESAVESVKIQHTDFIKLQLGQSFSDMMDLTRFIPPVTNMTLILKQMKGVLSSFYHSNTGVFAKGMDQFLGCPLQNAYHVPGIGKPPGTGVFFSECLGRMTVVTCWIAGSFRAGEKQCFSQALWEDLGVEDVPASSL